MPNAPLRRVLFPTPPKNDDGTSTRSIQRIRPKAEVAPVNLDSTPTFKQLVENSPVPLAVAAATAAMRAAKSAQAGRPIITDMTRAAEEVIKNSEYNSIRPRHPSPRSLSSPHFSAARVAQSGSASLPPVHSPARRPAGIMNTLRTFFAPQRTTSRSSIPAPSNPTHHLSDTRYGNHSKMRLTATQSPSRTTGERIGPASSRPTNSIPATRNSPRKRHVTPVGKQPSPRAKYDPLSRLFGAVSPIPVEDAAETPIGGRGSLSHPQDTNSEVETSTANIESIEERRKTGSRKLWKVMHEAQTAENEENVTSRVQTRALKRARPRSNPIVHGDSKSGQPKKKRRMSEVLRLQKALESAAWTNSLAVEKQTEVIVISDTSPVRPRSDVTLKVENKTRRESEGVRKVVRGKAPRQITTAEKKSKLKKSVRSVLGPIKQKGLRDANHKATTDRQSKRRVTGAKRKRISEKDANLERADDGEEAAPNARNKAVVPKKQRKKETEQDKMRMGSFGKAAAPEKKQASDQDPVEIARGDPSKVSTPTLAERDAPLKKRISVEEHYQNSISKPKIRSPHTIQSSGNTRREKMSRKTSTPKRLSPPAMEDVAAPRASKETSEKAKQQEYMKGKR